MSLKCGCNSTFNYAINIIEFGPNSKILQSIMQKGIKFHEKYSKNHQRCIILHQKYSISTMPVYQPFNTHICPDFVPAEIHTACDLILIVEIRFLRRLIANAILHSLPERNTYILYKYINLVPF